MKIHQMMKNRHCSEDSSFWWRFIIVIRIHHCDEDSSLWWKFVIVVKIHHHDENSSNVKNQHCDKNSSLSWELSIVITFMTTIGQILHYDKNSSVWWKFIIVMKIHHWDTNSLVYRNSSLWWKFINLSELIVVMKIHLGDEIDHLIKISSIDDYS